MIILVDNYADIHLFINNDETTLEYDDSVILIFTPFDPALITALEAEGEYIRDSATVNIIDDNSRCSSVRRMYYPLICVYMAHCSLQHRTRY